MLFFKSEEHFQDFPQAIEKRLSLHVSRVYGLRILPPRINSQKRLHFSQMWGSAFWHRHISECACLTDALNKENKNRVSIRTKWFSCVPQNNVISLLTQFSISLTREPFLSLLSSPYKRTRKRPCNCSSHPKTRVYLSSRAIDSNNRSAWRQDFSWKKKKSVLMGLLHHTATTFSVMQRGLGWGPVVRGKNDNLTSH